MCLETFSAPEIPKVCVLRAMGGAGKTQVALEYCRLSRETGYYSAIFWLDATSQASVKAAFETIAGLIESTHVAVVSKVDVVSLVLDHLIKWPERWLLVFDSFDDPVTFNNLQDFIPLSGPGSILITSRHIDTTALANTDGSIELAGLECTVAVDMLLARACLHREETNTAIAHKIVHRLGYHALAIDQAAAYISTTKIAVADFLPLYEMQERQTTILKRTPRMSQYLKHLTDSEEETSFTVFTTLELSYQQMITKYDDGEVMSRLLLLFSFFNGTDITEDCFSNCLTVFSAEYVPAWYDLRYMHQEREQVSIDRNRSDTTLSQLAQLSFIENLRRVNGIFHFSIHPLVQDWMRLRSDMARCSDDSLYAGLCLTSPILFGGHLSLIFQHSGTFQGHLEMYLRLYKVYDTCSETHAQKFYFNRLSVSGGICSILLPRKRILEAIEVLSRGRTIPESYFVGAIPPLYYDFGEYLGHLYDLSGNLEAARRELDIVYDRRGKGFREPYFLANVLVKLHLGTQARDLQRDHLKRLADSIGISAEASIEALMGYARWSLRHTPDNFEHSQIFVKIVFVVSQFKYLDSLVITKVILS